MRVARTGMTSSRSGLLDRIATQKPSPRTTSAERFEQPISRAVALVPLYRDGGEADRASIHPNSPALGSFS